MIDFPHMQLARFVSRDHELETFSASFEFGCGSENRQVTLRETALINANTLPHLS